MSRQRRTCKEAPRARFSDRRQPCASAQSAALRLRVDEDAPSLNRQVAARRSHAARPPRSRSTSSSSSRSMSTFRSISPRRPGSTGSPASEPRLKGMVAALPMERGKAIEAELEQLRQLKIAARHPPADPEPARPGFLHQAGLHRRAEAARAARHRLRHLRLPPSPAEHDQDGAAMPGGALRARPYRQAGDQGRRDRSVAAAHEGARRAAERLLQDLRRRHRSRPRNWTREQLKPYIAHAIEAFGFDRVMYGGDWHVIGARLAPTRNGSISSIG